MAIPTQLYRYSSPIFRAPVVGFYLLILMLNSGCMQPVLDANDPLEMPGPYPVERQNIRIPYTDSETLEATLFTPATETPSGLVIFLPGFGISYSAYASYLVHLASHGFISLGMNFPGNAFALDSQHDQKALQVVSAAAFLRKLHPGLDIAIAGHSMGGKLAFYAAALEPEIDVVMALDPVNAGGPPCFLFPTYCASYPVAPNPGREQRGMLGNIEALASLIMRSKPDPATNPEAEFNAQWFYFGSDGNGADAVPAPALYYDFGPLAHAGYVPLFNNEAIPVIKRTMIAWLDQHMRNEDRQEYLTGARITADVEAGRLLGFELR